jgi:hypothetical protein
MASAATWVISFMHVRIQRRLEEKTMKTKVLHNQHAGIKAGKAITIKIAIFRMVRDVRHVVKSTKLMAMYNKPNS